MNVAFDNDNKQEKVNIPLQPRKKRRQLERKLTKAKRNAWHQRQKVSYYFVLLILIKICSIDSNKDLF
jgi:hypothetical protein